MFRMSNKLEAESNLSVRDMQYTVEDREKQTWSTGHRKKLKDSWMRLLPVYCTNTDFLSKTPCRCSKCLLFKQNTKGPEYERKRPVNISLSSSQVATQFKKPPSKTSYSAAQQKPSDPASTHPLSVPYLHSFPSSHPCSSSLKSHDSPVHPQRHLQRIR